MKQFTYVTEQKMAPRGNNKFSTTYYKQTTLDRMKLSNFIEDICDQVVQMAKDTNNENLLTQPLNNKRHKHLDKTPYTIQECLDDLRSQLQDGKDVTESMITRWNCVFDENDDCQIDLVPFF
jgi:hypothetical protein